MSVFGHAGFPIDARLDQGVLTVALAAISRGAFTDAFCHETVARHAATPKTLHTYPKKTLARYADKPVGRQPAGIILHSARVGSTLHVRLLRCVQGLAVYSEPCALNALLFPPPPSDRPMLTAAIRCLGDILGQHAGAPFVIKLRSWHSLFAPLLLEAFPNTPWLFAVRDPVEVGVSVQRRPPTWMRLRSTTNNPFLVYAAKHGRSDTEEDYLASMLAAFYLSVATADHTNGLLTEYQNLPGDIWKVVCPHFHLHPTPVETQAMATIALLDAKRDQGIQHLFIPDGSEKQAAASHQLRSSVEEIAIPALHFLRQTFATT